MFFRIGRILRMSGRELLTLWYACRNSATPWGYKLIAILMLAYVLCPVDLVPDVLPVLGWLDDVTLLAFGVPALLSRLPPAITDQARCASSVLLSRLAFWR